MLTLPGLGGGSASNIYWRPAGGGGGEKTYIEDVFSAYLYKGNGVTVTVNNGIKLGNNNAGNSVQFDGTSNGNHLEVPKSTDFDFGTGAFTMEAWVYADSLTTGGDQYENLDSIFESIDWGAQLGQYSFGISHENKVYFYLYNNANTYYYGTTTLATQQWYHLAVSRDSSGNIRLFVNGSLESTNNNSYALSNSGQPNPARIGGCKINNNNAGQINKSFSGRISNLRVVKGQALYTSNFTPSTEALTTTSQSATASNVKLLCCQSSTTITGATVIPLTSSSILPRRESPILSSGPFTASDGEGGLIWTKARESTTYAEHGLIDTVRGVGQELQSNSDIGHNFHAQRINTLNNNGYIIGTSYRYNAPGIDYVSWTWRKQKGFFDIVSYSGDNAGSRDIAHNLGCIPGVIIIKRLDVAGGWWTYHRDLDDTSNSAWAKVLRLDTDGSQQVAYCLGSSTHQNASTFRVGSDNSMNTSGGSYVAYLFAGGASTAATARSVEFDGSGDYLSLANTSDLEPGSLDFTIEAWVRPDATADGYDYVFSNGWPQQLAWHRSGTSQQFHCWFKETESGGYVVSLSSSTSCAPRGAWSHVAVVRSGNVFTLYVNGNLEDSATHTGVVADTASDLPSIGKFGGSSGDSYEMKGQISNFRYVKGTAVYTSSFRPPTEPLTNITNTKLLCCNGSSTTSSTVTPGTITANGNPTASTDSPFDDPNAFKFGDNNENIIKTGSYNGNGSTTDSPEIYLGWQPQWILFKNATSTSTFNWRLYDSMRGIVTDGFDPRLMPNLVNAEEETIDKFDLTPTGFKLKTTNNDMNGSGEKIVYIAIRRPDGYVGKPPTVGSDVFSLAMGNGMSDADDKPTFISGFPVDWALRRMPTGGSGTDMDWVVYDRLVNNKYLRTNTTGSQSTSSRAKWDLMTGMNHTDDNTYQAWMWKRHAGCDVVNYIGNGGNLSVPHSLGDVPEMIWTKERSNAGTEWKVFHKDRGPTNILRLNNSLAEETNQTQYQSTTPTATHFFVKSSLSTNNSDYLAILFRSVDGICKVGTYSGSSSTQTITLGFRPRFFWQKRVGGSGEWHTVDTLRGWGSGADQFMYFDDSTGTGGYDFGEPTDTGFTLTGGADTVSNTGQTYIFYAHA
tara:strand:- start:53 stop:3436 length:3384 start_codon:yes stop_codon:yes gene_type:complete